MTALMISLVLGANQMKLSAPQWTFTDIEAKQGDVYQRRFLTLLGEKSGITVITAADVADVLGLERQRQLLGCADNGASCAAELAGAMGADAVLSGSLAKAGGSYVVTLRGVNTASGQAFATATGRLKTEEELFSWLEQEASAFAARLKESFATYLEDKQRVTYSYRSWPWFVIGGGAVVAIVGAIGFGVSRGILASLRSATAPENEARLVADGQLFQDGGVSLMFAGAGVAAIGAVLLFATRVPDVMVTLVPLNSGGMVAVRGEF